MTRFLQLYTSYTKIKFEFEINRQTTMCNTTETFIEIFDGGTMLAPSLGRYCPRPVTSTIVSTENMILVHYVASANFFHAEFRAKVHHNVCGGTHVIEHEFLFTSPNYPNKYDNNLDCKYLLHSGDADYIIKLTFLELNIINSATVNCTEGDFLEITETNENGRPLGRYCGTKYNNTSPLRSSSDTLFVSFKTNSQDSGRGFKILVTTVRDSNWINFNLNYFFNLILFFQSVT